MYLLEFALAISLVSLGSNQILFLPHFKTAADSRFWSLKVLKNTLNKYKIPVKLNDYEYRVLSSLVLAMCENVPHAC